MSIYFAISNRVSRTDGDYTVETEVTPFYFELFTKVKMKKNIIIMYN